MHHPEDYSRKELEQAIAHLSNGQKQLLACYIMRNMVLPSGRKPWDMLNVYGRFAVALVERENRGLGENRPYYWRAATLHEMVQRESDYNVNRYVLVAAIDIMNNAHRAWSWYDCPPPVEDPEATESAIRAATNCVVKTVQTLAQVAALEVTGVPWYSTAIKRHIQQDWAAVYDAAVQTAVQMAQNFSETAIRPTYTPPYAAGTKLICVKDVSFGNNMSPCNPAIYTNEHSVKEGERLTVATADFGKHSWWLLTFNEFPGGWYADGAFRNSFIPERNT